MKIQCGECEAQIHAETYTTDGYLKWYAWCCHCGCFASGSGEPKSGGSYCSHDRKLRERVLLKEAEDRRLELIAVNKLLQARGREGAMADIGPVTRAYSETATELRDEIESLKDRLRIRTDVNLSLVQQRDAALTNEGVAVRLARDAVRAANDAWQDIHAASTRLAPTTDDLADRLRRVQSQ